MIERLYRALLYLAPRGFRERFGDEVLETARCMDARGGGWRHRTRATIDGFRTIVALHADHRADRPRLNSGRSSPMEGLRGDLSLALRGFRREPSFAAFVVATLALATGANAALFGIADRLLFRGPTHVVRPESVVRLYVTAQPPGMATFTGWTVGHVMYEIARTSTPSADAVASYAINEGTVGRGADARAIQVGYASASFFPLLGVQPAVGRFFSSADDSIAGAGRVAVLSQGAASRLFGDATSPVGRDVVLNDEPHVVIGIAPRGFTGAELGPVDVWVPINLLSPRITPDWTHTWSAQWLTVILRLREGATRQNAESELTAAVRGAYTGDEIHMKAARIWVAGLSAGDSGAEPAETRVVRWLFAVALVVLFIACANVVNLLLARGSRRTRDIAVRLALGASRARVVRMLLVESVLLAAIGCAAGLAFAYFIGGLARTTLLEAIEWTSSPVDGRVLAVSAAGALLLGIGVGLVPALGMARESLGRGLRAGIRDGGGHRLRLRSVLTMVQATLSVALLIGAGLFVRSIWNARHVDLGIDADRVLVAGVQRTALTNLPEGPARDRERVRRRTFLGEVLDRARAIPGVDTAAVAVGLPFGNRFGVRVRVPGMDVLPKVSTGGPGVSAVSADYFATMGTRILRGRSFTHADRAGSAPVAIVSEFMARIVWPDADPIGRCVMLGQDDPPCATIVGVAENTHRFRLIEEPKMHVYIPLGQEVGFGGAVLLVRGAGAPATYAEAVTRELLAADPTITFVNTDTIQDRIDPQLRSWQLGTATLAFSGLLALIVAAVGIYSVLAYIVADRRHEMGVRIALGAGIQHVAGMVLRWSLSMASIGVVAGWGIAAATAAFVQPLLFRVSARDPLVFGSVGFTLLAVAILASLGPALRAARVDPIEALRTE